jgi:hypothetical protein
MFSKFHPCGYFCTKSSEPGVRNVSIWRDLEPSRAKPAPNKMLQSTELSQVAAS